MVQRAGMSGKKRAQIERLEHYHWISQMLFWRSKNWQKLISIQIANLAKKIAS
jgi:hypothetical protein